MKLKKYLFILFSLGLLTSCEDYVDINKSSTGVTDDDLKPGGLIYGTQLMEMQQRVIPIGSPSATTGPGNDLAVTDIMSSGNYIGYFGMNNNWKLSTEATWDFADNRMHYAYEQLYMKVYQPWVQIYQKIGKSDDPAEQEIMSIFNVVKVIGWLRATDSFGPIAYSQAGSGDIAPDLDKQQDVYKFMLQDLEACAATLNKATSKIMPKYDLIYDGDPIKWTKLTNSIMLRMAVRVHFVDKELSKEYIAKALDPKNGGVIETKSDEAKIGNTSKYPLLNSLIATIDYGENRMGATAWAYLTGYSDPRLSKYYTQGTYRNTAGYYCVAPGNTQAKGEGANTAQYASSPKVENSDPLYWFRASETYFLKAEAALYELTSGNAKSLYEEGVKMSMDEWGIAVNEATAYLEKGSEVKTASLNSNDNYHYNGWTFYSSDISADNVSPKWDETATQEKQLQQIITQKYLALYPNGVEAWTEYRRTGYPYLMALFGSNLPNKIGAESTARAPERFSFASNEYNGNPSMDGIATLLNGPDKGGTKLWWVRPNRPVQK